MFNVAKIAVSAIAVYSTGCTYILYHVDVNNIYMDSYYGIIRIPVKPRNLVIYTLFGNLVL